MSAGGRRPGEDQRGQRKGVEVVYNKSLCHKSPMVTRRYKSESLRQDARNHSTTDGDFLEQKICPFPPLSESNIHQVI